MEPTTSDRPGEGALAGFLRRHFVSLALILGVAAPAFAQAQQCRANYASYEKGNFNAGEASDESEAERQKYNSLPFPSPTIVKVYRYTIQKQGCVGQCTGQDPYRVTGESDPTRMLVGEISVPAGGRLLVTENPGSIYYHASEPQTEAERDCIGAIGTSTAEQWAMEASIRALNSNGAAVAPPLTTSKEYYRSYSPSGNCQTRPFTSNGRASKTTSTSYWWMVPDTGAVVFPKPCKKPIKPKRPLLPNACNGKTKGVGDPVLLDDGSWHVRMACLTADGGGLPINVSLEYSSNAAVRSIQTDSALPPGWTASYTRWMKSETDSTGATVKVIVTESGDEYRFTRQANGSYRNDQSFDYSSLSVNAEGNFELKYADGNVEIFAGTDGVLIGLRDRVGNRLSVVYNPATQTRTIRNERTGQSLLQKYANVGSLFRLVSIEDGVIPAGATARKVFLGYDASGKLTSFTDASGRVFIFGYGESGFVESYANPLLGNSTQSVKMVYDDSGEGRVIQQFLPNKMNIEFDYRSLSNTNYHLEVVFDRYKAFERKQRFLFQTEIDNGALVSTGRILREYVTNSTTQFTEYRYDARGNRTDVIDPAGRRTEFVYDANGFVTQQRVYKTATTYDTTSFVRNSFGQPTTITDPNGTQTTYNYNASTGLLTSMVRTGTTRNTSNTDVSTSQTTTIQYDNGTSGIELAGSPTAVFPGLPTQITLPDGTLIKQQYDSLGHPTITTLDHGTDKLNLTATSAHDWRGFLTSSTDLRGIVTNYEYANNPASGQYGNLGIASAMVEDVGGRNVRTEFTRDAMLNVTKQIDDVGGLNAETQIDWHMVGTEAEYSPIELRVKERMNGTTPVWRRQKFDYLPFGEIKTLEEVGALANGGNRTTTFTYTAQGWLDTIKTHDNRTVLDYTYSANLSGTIDSVSDARGVRTTFTWDPKGRLATITNGSADVEEADFGGSNLTRSAINALTTLTYDNEDRVTKAEVIRNNGTTRTLYEHVYDQLDRLQRVKDGVGNEHDFYYDANRDWLIEQRLANNNAAHRQTTRLEYDAVGRMLRHVVDPSGLNLTTSYSYNESGVSDKWLLAKVINPRGKATQYRYDSLGALRSTIDPNGSTFEYSYNNLSHLVKMATLSPTGLEVNAASHYGVNLLGEVETLCRKAGATNLAACTGPGSMTESWQYKTDGMVKQMTDLSGQVIAYAYDDAGRLTSTNYAGTSDDPNGNRSDASYTYYPNDLLRTATSKPDGTNSETTQYEYDASNRLLNRIRGGRTVGYGYDKDDSLSSMDYWGRGSLGYARNGNGLVQTLSLWNNSASTSYAYRATNQLQSITRNNSNALNTTFGYDTAQRLIKLASAGNNGNFLTLANTRQVSGIETGNLDANGNPLSLVETIRGESGSKTTTYEYDDLDRLYIARMPEISTAIPGYSEITRYDASGNRIERTRTYADSNRRRSNHGDLNRDGTADISWTHHSSGAQAHWYMTGTNSEVNGGGALLTGIPAGWVMEARADFNHDGVIDALARSRSPADKSEIWIMGGVRSDKILARIPLSSPGASWYVHATGDFNRDGSIDLVWRNYSTGDNYIWYMTGADGATYVSSSALINVGPSWRLSGAGDFDQDGTPDLVWLDGSWAGGSGMFAIWKMGGADGSSFVSGQGFQQGLVGWIIDGVADVDNDGDPDIQWHNYQSGHRVNWIMDGFAIQPSSTIFTDAPTPLDWVAHATGQERLSAQSQFMTYSPLDLNTNGGVLSNANQSLSQSSDGQTYAYDAAERLMKTSQTDGSSIEYQYDALGNLVRSTQIKAGTTTTSEYVIDEGVALPVLLGEIASSTTGTTTTVKETHYAYGAEGLHAQRSCDVVSGALQNCALHYALVDRLGSVRMLTDGSNVTSTTHYDAWGQIRSQNGTAKSGLAFTGEQQFADGTVYLRARHYLPSQGRLLQRDSFAGFLDRPQSLNRFAYVEGMATSAVDPSGFEASAAHGVGTVAGGVGNMISGGSLLLGSGVAGPLAAVTGPAGATQLGAGTFQTSSGIMEVVEAWGGNPNYSRDTDMATQGAFDWVQKNVKVNGYSPFDLLPAPVNYSFGDAADNAGFIGTAAGVVGNAANLVKAARTPISYTEKVPTNRPWWKFWEPKTKEVIKFRNPTLRETLKGLDKGSLAGTAVSPATACASNSAPWLCGWMEPPKKPEKDCAPEAELPKR